MNVDTLDFIRSCIKRRKIHWTYHVNMRLKGRSISRKTILSSANSYEIIEQYPEDKYLPSCLVYAEYENQIIHIQIAMDLENESVTIVTAYKPSLDKWEKDLKTRRRL